MHRVPFVSQRDYAFAGVACGVAATMMLLKYHLRPKQIPSYLDLRKALGVHILPTGKRQRNGVWGVDTDDVTKYFRRRGISYRATHHNTPTTMANVTRRLRRAPLMVGMGKHERRWGKSGHWIVLTGIDDDYVTYLDPQFPRSHSRPSRLPIRDFRRQWDGVSVQIALR
jgi:uncharacterized protein YvpB